ncbi:type VI secretion protein [Paraburkholderia acidicola]|uniref:Type VI secretion protein n=1 Tax=Paraburkholderia acidicola TaxID=1912599 RepID=A0A2A4F1Q3_9BURK|nr:type VI secretion system baseplate subunit TssG [Paraburkholderia acidicola]PCE27311.1 type VI secretion protein [Paraburkholderia acidicola]
MNFFRFCELVELAAPGRPPIGTTDSPANEPVRFRSRARIGFPTREIDAVEYDVDNPAMPPAMRTTFLGLYGVDARMPAYFVDEVAQNREGAEPMSAFLDLFHHRVVTQYYRVWRKYRYPAGFRSAGTDDISRYLLSFAGLGIGNPETGTAVGTRKLLSMLGLTGQKTRTVEGLAGVLQHAVPDAWIAVEEFYPVWVNVEGREPAALGENCLLGRGFYDRSNSVHVVITPQTRESVLGLMPGRGNHREVMALLRFYLGYEAQAHLEMHVRAELMPAQLLNSDQVSLGYTTQLPQPGAQDRANAVTRVQLGVWTGSRDRQVSQQRPMH